MNTFCTLFNSAYAHKGIAMLESFAQFIEGDYQFFVLAMDSQVEGYLNGLKLKNTVILNLADLEGTRDSSQEVNSELLLAKSNRSEKEYCWTCSSALIRYCLNKFNPDSCTYVDADLYFFSNPLELIREATRNNKAVLITPHHFTWAFDHSIASGKYCVQFMYFENRPNSKRVLEKWYQQCIEWCSAIPEGNKLGDQKYLDTWLTDYPDVVHSLQGSGAGGPWNIQKFGVTKNGSDSRICLEHGGMSESLVFFHFHGLHRRQDGSWYFGPYPLNQSVREIIYYPYLSELERIERECPPEIQKRLIDSRIQSTTGRTIEFKLKKTFWKIFGFILRE